ncbi:hypothetical protein CDG77_25770 [Nostoc sp. 'Peltigera membranacea cyanobiont' 213]|nr:hypothetical protein CDG77_25770 [Nostoc sp. 'Peltigera membranacea cyanobiont' 213]
MKKAVLAEDRRQKVCNQCRLLFSTRGCANETLREQTYTDCKIPVAEILGVGLQLLLPSFVAEDRNQNSIKAN